MSKGINLYSFLANLSFVLEEKEKLRVRKNAEFNKSYCAKFERISNLLTDAIEELRSEKKISDALIEEVDRIERVTGSFITAATSEKEVAEITRFYLELTNRF